jgi:hypothetical protein
MWSLFLSFVNTDGALISIQPNENGFAAWMVLAFLVFWGALALTLIGTALSDLFKGVFQRKQPK